MLARIKGFVEQTIEYIGCKRRQQDSRPSVPVAIKRRKQMNGKPLNIYVRNSIINQISKPSPPQRPQLDTAESLYHFLISPEDETNRETLQRKHDLLLEAASRVKQIENDLLPQPDYSTRMDSAIISLRDLEISHQPVPWAKIPDQLLSSNQMDQIQQILSPKDEDESICKVGDITLKYKDIVKLKPGTWLNDELVNAYVKLLPTKSGKYFIHNSFFYTKLESLATRSTFNLRQLSRIYKRRKVTNLFSLERIFFPINMRQVHWTFACINIPNSTIEYYDSIPDFSNLQSVTEPILKYINAEVQAAELEQNFVPLKMSTPQQTNSSDCGVFMLKTMEEVARDQTPNFTQDDISNFRKQMILQLNNNRLDV